MAAKPQNGHPTFFFSNLMKYQKKLKKVQKPRFEGKNGRQVSKWPPKFKMATQNFFSGNLT
jgi:hypothetical protein